MLDLIYLVASLLIVAALIVIGIAPIYANHYNDTE